MAFIKDFECRSCGSTLGRWADNENTNREDRMCFVCGIGDFQLSAYECANLDYPSALEAVGREWGHVSTILPRINTPSSLLSRRAASQRAADSLFYIVRDTSELDYSFFDAVAEVGKEVIEAMEQMIKENKQDDSTCNSNPESTETCSD